MGAISVNNFVCGDLTVREMEKLFFGIAGNDLVFYGSNTYSGTFATNSGASVPVGVDLHPMPSYIESYIAETHWLSGCKYLTSTIHDRFFGKWGDVIAFPAISEKAGTSLVPVEEEMVQGIRVSTKDVIIWTSWYNHDFCLDLLNKNLRSKVENKIKSLASKRSKEINSKSNGEDHFEVHVTYFSCDFPTLKKSELKKVEDACLINPGESKMLRLSDVIGERNITAKIEVTAFYNKGELELQKGWLFSGLCAN